MANVKDVIFLQDPKSSLLSETFFQCLEHSNGRHLRSGEKNTVCDRSSTQYSSNAFCRFRYYPRQCFRHIHGYSKLVQSRHRPPRRKIQYLLQQVGLSLSLSNLAEILQLGHTSLCSTICKFFVTYFEDYRTDTVVDPAGAFPSLHFPMGMSGEQVAGYSQNTSILPITVSTIRAR